MSVYVYCVSDEVTGDALAGLRGLGGEPARLLAHAGLSAVVSPFAGEPVPVTREHVLAHSRVNAQVLAQTTPLPFRFGTLVTEARLAAYLEERGEDLRAALAFVRGGVEMGVKLMWDAAAEARAAGQPGGAGDEAGVPAAGGGTAFLLAKRRVLRGEEELRRRADELAAWLDARVSDLARATRARVRPSDSLVVRAAHLVTRERVADYRARLRDLRQERPDLRFLTSGPWPPYSFAALD